MYSTDPGVGERPRQRWSCPSRQDPVQLVGVLLLGSPQLSHGAVEALDVDLAEFDQAHVSQTRP